MVGVHVRRHDHIEPLDIACFQKSVDDREIAAVARIDEHRGAIRRFKKNAVALTDVDEIGVQRFPIPGGRTGGDRSDSGRCGRGGRRSGLGRGTGLHDLKRIAQIPVERVHGDQDAQDRGDDPGSPTALEQTDQRCLRLAGIRIVWRACFFAAVTHTSII